MLANGHRHPIAGRKLPAMFKAWHGWLFLAVALSTAGVAIGIGWLVK